jgi:site-specific DNA-cytosine methylase
MVAAELRQNGLTKPQGSLGRLEELSVQLAGIQGKPIPQIKHKAIVTMAGDHGVPGGENTLRLDGGNVRYFSIRECARLQTFPDDWVFEGSWTEAMRQIQNNQLRLIEQCLG